MQIHLDNIPLLPGVLALAEQGMVTGASGRNWEGYGHDIALPAGISSAQQALLSDPQTSGGLLVTCAPEAVDQVLACFHSQGFADARVIGQMTAGRGVEVL